MQARLRVKRFNPEIQDGATYYQDYVVGIENHFTVLDTLIKVREEVDGTLGLRCSCRSAICGSCSMRVNGHATLACKAKMVSMMDGDGKVEVEPMGNMPVIKDLVSDMKPFWDRVRAVDPWLQPEGPVPEGEYIASDEAMMHLTGVMGCIMCGACVSDCTVLEVDDMFLGPAALAKAYRFVADPRDDVEEQRLGKLEKYGGIWDCTRCYECVQVCPKGVAPMDRIMALRDRAVQAGLIGTTGARHTEIFTESVRHSGWLDELRLAVKTPGIFNIPAQLSQLRWIGIKAALRGKMPPVFHKSIPGVAHVRRIFDKIEGEQ